MVKTLITGAQGQLGHCLADTAPAEHDLILTDLPELDLADQNELAEGLASLAPDLIINAAAYTAVDRAEEEPDIAEQVNAAAVSTIAEHCQAYGIRLIHISTDFVFDGQQTAPYQPVAEPNPLSVYGRTKLAGERAALSACATAQVVRSSWIYSEYGHNFVKTMLRLASARDELQVVNDQIGSPTYARNLAQMIWSLADASESMQIHHFTDAGTISWYDFAAAIFDEAKDLGLLGSCPELQPISSKDYNAPAPRPAYSVLDCTLTCEALGIEQSDWRESLRAMLARLMNNDFRTTK